MRVELTEKVGEFKKTKSGEVAHVLLHAKESTAWYAEDSPQRRDGEVVLAYVPSLLVRFDGYADGPIPGHPDMALLEPDATRSFPWEWKTQTSMRCRGVRYSKARYSDVENHAMILPRNSVCTSEYRSMASASDGTMS